MIRTFVAAGGLFVSSLALGMGPLDAGAPAQADAHLNDGGSPLVSMGVGQSGLLELVVDRDALETIARNGGASISGFPLAENVSIDVELEPFEVFTRDARILVDDQEIPLPEVTLLRGTIEGEAGSLVFLSVSEFATEGFVRTGGLTYVIASKEAPIGRDAVISELGVATADAPGAIPPVCGMEGLYTDEQLEAAHREIEQMLDQYGDDVAPLALRGSDACRALDIAVDTDYEFSAWLFGNNHTAASAYVATLFGAVSTVYERDVGVQIRVPFVRLWSSEAEDPYDNDRTDETLGELRSIWNSTMDDVDRDLAHHLSPRSYSDAGGRASLSAVCGLSGYGVSGYINGSFPQPLQSHRGGNWDPVVVAHEVGHNCGAPHTHSYSPPLDGCGNGNCSQAFGGTIMSYCHTCGGGMSNIAVEFHPTVRSTIIAYLSGAAPCDLAVDPVIIETQPEDTDVCLGLPASLQVTATGGGNVPLTYQWFKGATALDGETGATLSIPFVSFDDEGAYSVRIDGECSTAYSNTVTLSVCGTDCNDNGLDDAIDIAQLTSADCNSNGVPDECDISPTVVAASSGERTPIGAGWNQQFTMSGALDATTDVTISLFARGDLDATQEQISVMLNGETIGNVFALGAGVCSVPADEAEIVLTAGEFNDLLALGGGDAVFDLVASPAMDAVACAQQQTMVRIDVAYQALGTSADDDQNGVPDECAVPDCPGDLTTTGGGSAGVPDGVTDLSDLLYFVGLWEAEDPSADLTTTGQDNGIPDGMVDLADLLRYVNTWQDGIAACP